MSETSRVAPKPGPRPRSRRVCNRYGADGSPCTNLTVRFDGWCGECDGFTHREPPSTNGWDRGLPAHFQTNPQRQVWTPCPRPLDPDEAHDVSVGFETRRKYAQIHACTLPEAEAQIRSLLEDLLHSGRIERRNEDGRYRIMAKKRNYLLLLTADAEVVTDYFTKHNERTWAQFKAGVESRSTSESASNRAWLRVLLATQESKVRITGLALKMYAKSRGTVLNQSTASVLLEQMTDLVDHDIFLRRGADDDRVFDDEGRLWVIREDQERGGHVLVAFVKNPDPAQADAP